jgi:hypothetical protein
MSLSASDEGVAYVSLLLSKFLSNFFLKEDLTLSLLNISPSIKEVLIASSVSVSISICLMSSLLKSFEIPSNISNTANIFSHTD